MDKKLAELKFALQCAISGLTADELIRHPGGHWSALQVLDHLNLTYLGTIKNFENCLATGLVATATGEASVGGELASLTWAFFLPAVNPRRECIRAICRPKP
jgi:hypothetical protein